MNPANIPFIVNCFGNPTAIARSLGLVVELPDVDNEDHDYWDRFDRSAWRQSLVGQVDMTTEEMVRGDPDWVRLKHLGGSVEVWFDLEEGIRFRCAASEVARVVAIIRQLAALDSMMVSAGQVVANQTVAGGNVPYGLELAAFLEPAGFRWDQIRWTLRT